MTQHFGSHASYRPQPLGEAFLTLLERDQMRLLRICAALEKIADGLPGTGHQRKTGKVLAFLDKAFSRHVFLHEKCLFPLIRSLEEKNEPLELMLRELEFEHAADRGLIVEILSAFMGRDSRNIGLEALGYLLRSFFENYRRHAAWERATAYPIVRKHLAGDTRKQHEALLRVSMGPSVSDAILRAAALC
ncbi:MAG: hemerythrin domain-containing protein [Rhodomicrobium sp.]